MELRNFSPKVKMDWPSCPPGTACSMVFNDSRKWHLLCACKWGLMLDLASLNTQSPISSAGGARYTKGLLSDDGARARTSLCPLYAGGNRNHLCRTKACGSTVSPDCPNRPFWPRI